MNEDKLLEANGQIKFFLGDVDIIVKQKDVVGNIIQEWLQGWLDKNSIEYAINDNPQMPPDFFLNPDNRKENLLEVKAFYRKANPGFDIADFRMYEEEIIEKPYMLHVDYLIFGYDMSKDGIVTIKELWIKKVWQITRRMTNWALNLQIKAGVVHKIRPGVWYTKNKSIFPMFKSLEHFISAIEETVYQNPKTHDDGALWRKKFLFNYHKFYNIKLKIPRWDTIIKQYEK